MTEYKRYSLSVFDLFYDPDCYISKYHLSAAFWDSLFQISWTEGAVKKKSLIYFSIPRPQSPRARRSVTRNFFAD